MKRVRWVFIGLALLAAACLVLTGCMVAATEVAVKKPAKTKATVACAPKGKLVRAITPDAKLVAFKCFFKPYKKVKSLHFMVKLRNVSDQPQRFRVNIFLADGRAVGGLVPRKTKKGLIKPGAEASFTYPVKGLATPPTGVTLIVKTMGK